MAVAARGGNAAQQRGRIRPERKRAGEQANRNTQQPTGKPLLPGCSNTWTCHEPSCFGCVGKTDSAERLGVPLPGFWDSILGLRLQCCARAVGSKLPSPILGSQPMGSRGCCLANSNCNILNHLGEFSKYLPVCRSCPPALPARKRITVAQSGPNKT